MNLRCIVLKISIVLLFFPSFYFAQTQSLDTLQFAKHLKQTGLLNEQVVFNRLLQSRTNNGLIKDSLNLDLALVYHQLHLPDSSKNALRKISNNCCYSESMKSRYLSVLLVNKELNAVQTFLDKKTLPSLYRNNAALSVHVLKRTLSVNDTSALVSAPLLDIRRRYSNPPAYSPVLAGVYSALIPGLGKFYIGYKKQALTAFISNTLFAAQTIESYVKSGVKSPRFIITASVFTIFYSGNIIGSITAAKKKKRDYYNEFDYEILNYYNTNVN